ncbi:Toxin RTX-I translocation ATP-binding protein [Labrenzia sp. THAF191b]|uniref:peptidase domain-containing ABC transporter n=1 Tax=unclassified Labrenzia TaxID=2648686 RepID=UPI001268A692|nr:MULTISPECIES: ABC transporter transmembrane domain-containing protein [unclassified Labrenzia]QFS99943.1 Toxin RTX-I translocation ATP-binding protein [Labrenzia sp. THAF191b]QFT06257.1 Toxin RTX-I translocation ATP-binding protein [Labrenzia sp. THAF191a]QFT17801.1 Toxin RTX-I translocation ATP-binding protein [Labrenzia sp. THAF187b]
MSRPLFNLEDVHAADNAVHRQWRDLSAELAADGTATGRLGLPEDGAAPAERCLIPLLQEMRWQGNDRLLFEALPHFDRIETFQVLRTVLSRLTVKTTPFHGSAGELTHAQMPCLRVTRDDVQVLVGKTGTGEFRAYSGRQGEAISVPAADILKSEIYLAAEDTEEQGQVQNNRSWFSTVSKRFRTSIISILALGFVLNILALAPPLFIMAIYDKAMGAKSTEVLLTMAVGVGIILLCEVALRRMKTWLQSYLGGRVDAIVGNKTFERILHLPYAMLSEAPIGTQVMRLRYFDSVRDIFQSSLFNAIVDIPFTLIFIVAIFLIGGPVALPPLALLTIYTLLAVYVLPKVQREVAAVGEQKSKLNSFMIETFRNQRALRNLSVEDIWLERFSALSTNFNKLNIHARHITHVLQTLSQTLMTICGVLVLGIGAIRVMEGEMSLGALIATMALSWRVLNPMNQAFLSITQLAQSRTVIEQINNLMKVQLEREPGHLPKITRDIRGDLKVSSLVLRYPGATEASLKGLELTVKEGETVAITGPSGSGKTALFQAVIGLFQPQVGSILFDGLDVRQLDTAEWRSSIGYAPDDLDFFYGTVKQNLLMSDPGASDERLIEVTGKLGLLSYLEENFNGLETRLNGEVLKQIPDNMKQRIVLARAFVKAAPLYLFDNPGTHLDFEGDKKFMAMIEELKGKATILINTQRPSHMKMANRVVVLRGGQIAMMGPPEQVVPALMGQTAKAG